MSALAAAKVHNDEYQRRINIDVNWGLEERTRYEMTAYHQCMMQAAIAQAEALAAIAEALAIINESKAKEPYLPQR